METRAFSAGGILSTSEDSASFVNSLQKGYELDVKNLKINGENLIAHSGSIPCYFGIAMYNEVKHSTIVVLTNLSIINSTQHFVEIQVIILTDLFHQE